MFLITELIIYAVYLVFDLSGSFSSFSSILKFLSICLCYFAIDVRRWDIKRIMALTVIADFFLVLTDFYDAGLFFFILVQMNYYRFITKSTYFPYRHMGIMICLGFLLSVIVHFFIMPVNLCVFLALVYFSALIFNIFTAVNLSCLYDEYRYVAICLCLILCCDIHVAVTNIFSSGIWYSFGLIAMWLFYLPSQVIIALLYSTRNRHLPFRTRTR